MKFFKCPICGNVIVLVNGNEKLIKCCGVSMEELLPNVEDASEEKHVPVYTIDGEFVSVKVGEIEHPMTEEHQILFIAQVINDDIKIIKIKNLLNPEVRLKYVKGSKIYAYCNIHGLWMNDVK